MTTKEYAEDLPEALRKILNQPMTPEGTGKVRVIDRATGCVIRTIEPKPIGRTVKRLEPKWHERLTQRWQRFMARIQRRGTL